MFSWSFVLALLPFVIFLWLLLYHRWSLLRVSVIMLALVSLVIFIYWQILPSAFLTSYYDGVLVAVEILVVILGALFFLEVLRDLGVLDNISYHLETISKDYRVQMILLAWFFGAFLEGTAGFGVPGLIVAPLLVGLGLSPLRAVIVALLGNSTPVIFGAAGTPIRTGLAGLEVAGVPALAVSLNLIGFLVPIFMLWIILTDQPNRKEQFREALPFALLSGLAFVIPARLFVVLGQEFPSILGSLVGFLLILVLLKLNWFAPKTTRLLKAVRSPNVDLQLSRALWPYGLLIGFLIAGKVWLGESSWFNPGFFFVLAGLPSALIWGSHQRVIKNSFWFALKNSAVPFLVIAAMATVVQLLSNSAQNYSALPSAIALLSQSFETPWLPFLAPLVGAFGSFITGSATLSNLLFGHFLSEAAITMGFSSIKVIALGLVGAAAGNMIALADVLAAETVVGVKNKEAEVIKGIALPFIIYLLLAGALGLLII